MDEDLVFKLKRQLRFLGHLMSETDVVVDPEKTQAGADFTTPTDVKTLQRFSGLAGWFHKFIPHPAFSSTSLK